MNAMLKRCNFILDLNLETETSFVILKSVMYCKAIEDQFNVERILG